ncbi:MAG: beta-galactosidase [Actinomycetota bacterium]
MSTATAGTGAAGTGDTWRVVEIHYFRVPRERWDLMLLRARQSGANAVSTYIPWLHHEPADGQLDFTGASLPERDLVGFVQACADAGLGFIAKPGPFCDAEMIGGGTPTWLIEAHPDWWAKRYDGRTLRHSDSYDARLSYDSPGYHERAAQWLGAVAVALRPFVGSALWAWQIDNEAPGDGMLVHEADDAESPLRADYADDSRWQAFLQNDHGTVHALNEAWGTSYTSFADVPMPREWDTPTTVQAVRRWMELDRFADHQVSSGLGAFAAAVRAELGDAVPLFHDWLCMPWPLTSMIVEPAALAEHVGWLGQNVYAEGVDPAGVIASTDWYRMDDAEYVHHAWWRTRLAATLSDPGRPHLVPEISGRQAFYLQCCLAGGMDAPCIYMLHSSEPEPPGIGAFQRWAEEAPILPDGVALPWWWNIRCLFLALQAGGADLAASPLVARVAIATDQAGERLARYDGSIAGVSVAAGTALHELSLRASASRAGLAIARVLVDAGVEFDVVDATRGPLERYDRVIVPGVSVMSLRAQQRLAAVASARAGSVVLAGAGPSHDERLAECSLLEGLPAWSAPPALGLGVDVARRTGASGQRYLTVVNRSRSAWAGDVDGLAVRSSAASVTWVAVGVDGDVHAALLHGDDAGAGALRSSRGQTTIALLDDAWHVVTSETCTVRVPGAAGRDAWRVLLSGEVDEAGVVYADGSLHVVHLDDRGHTDRYVLGDRAEAEQVAQAVGHYRLATLAHVSAVAERLGIPVGELGHRLRRLRSAVAAGAAPDDAELLADLTRVVSRMNDLRLWRS